MRLRAIGRIFREAVVGWWNDNVPRLGASLSFYTVFSLAPVLVISIAIAGLAFRPEVVRGEVVTQLQNLVGGDAAKAIQAMLEGASKPSESRLATGLGLFTFFLGATGAFLELQAALNGIWHVKPKPWAGWKALLVPRLISFGLVVAVGFLLLVALVVSAALAVLTRYIDDTWPTVAGVGEAANLLLSLLVTTILFALIYKVLPDVELRWRHVWVGGAVTAVFFTLGKFLIGFYLGRSGMASTYGAAGSVVVLILWVYYSSQIVLLGAEFTRAYVAHFEPPPPPSPHATEDPDPAALRAPARA